MIRLKRNKKILRWTFFLVIPLFIYTGCGDLEPDMQDTRTVILNMDFHGKSSSRSSSSVSTTELSNYRTHLIMVLTSGKNLSNSSYWNYNSNLGEYVLNDSDRKITLNMKLNTEMEIFAFLFREKYLHPDLISAKREAGYYGKSQSFKILPDTDSLQANIRLTQVSGTDTAEGADPGGGTDNTAPTVTFSPHNGATAVPISSNITITFSEAVRNIDDTPLTDSNIDSLITLRYSATGANIAFDATIDANKQVITIDPTSNLSYSQAVYVYIGTTVEDVANNAIAATSATFITTMDPSLEAFYPFNGNANDLTSNGRNLVDYGETTLIAGKDNSSNSAYYFDGDEDYLEYTGIIPSFDSYTISLWAKPASSGTYEAMFSSYDDPDKGFQIDLDVGNFHIRKAGASGGNIVLSAAQLEVWTFIAFTYDGTNSIGYINDNITVSDPGGTTEFNRFRIGKNRNGGTHFTGAIDELRIYNRALTASEISSLYANM